MKIIFFIGFVFVLTQNIYAQQPITFERVYSDSGVVEGRRVRQTYDGGYIVAGRRNAPGAFFSNDGTLMKTDSLGNIEWLKVYGTTLDDDWFYDVQQTSDSGFVACGYMPQMGMAENIYVVKTDKYGDTLWTKAYGTGLGDISSSVNQTYDGGYIVAGIWDTAGILLRLTQQGDTLWTRQFYDGYIFLYSVEQTADSGFVATGVLESNDVNLNLQIYVVRVDKDGNILWEKNYGNAGADYGHSVKVLPDNNFIVGGYSWLPPGDYESYLLKLDALGDTIWTKVYSDPKENGIKEIALCQDGGFALAEGKSVLGRSYELSIVRTDSSGNFLWRQEYGGTEGDYTYGITACRNGGFAICGSFGIWAAASKLYLIKLNESGLLSAIENYSNTQNIAIKIGPNPCQDNLFIDLSGLQKQKNYNIILCNASGQVLQSTSTNSPNIAQLQTFHLPTGIYFLRILDEDYVIQTFKIIHY